VCVIIGVAKICRVEEFVEDVVGAERVGMERRDKSEWSTVIEGVGQKFEDAKEFRIVVTSYCIAIGRGFKYLKNDSRKVIAKCTEEGCGWRIYASFHKADHSFGIRKCNLEHSCGIDNLKNRDHPKANAKWVASIICEKVRRDSV